jgi:transposase
VVARDRAEAYADGAARGAPTAVQVSDRFHLVRNAGAALDALLRGRRRLLDRAAVVTVAAERTSVRSAPDRPPSPTRRQEEARRAARVARWERAHALRAQGFSVRAVARELGVERSTARNLLAWDVPPHNREERPRPGGLTSPILQPFVPYLQDRWRAGCTNAWRLFREIAARGYTGSRSTLAAAVRAWRTAPERVVRRFNVRWLCLRSPEKLDDGEREALARVLAAHPDLASAHDLLRRFRRLVADRDLAALGVWVADARASGLAPFEGFANGLSADRPAIDAAFRLPWSTGPVEGHVHRLKLIKRRGYGRAKLDLLRARVLAA